MRGEDWDKSFYTQMFFPNGHRACTAVDWLCYNLSIEQGQMLWSAVVWDRQGRLVVVLSMLSISSRNFDISGGTGRRERLGLQQE